jgi:NADH-quinone oxidoreductase subunit N
MSTFSAFLPELVLLVGALALFGLTLQGDAQKSRTASLALAAAFIASIIYSFNETASLFADAYRVDGFSQLLKLVVGFGYGIVEPNITSFFHSASAG